MEKYMNRGGNKPMRNRKRPAKFNTVNDRQVVKSRSNGHRVLKTTRRNINKVTGTTTYLSVITLIVNDKE